MSDNKKYYYLRLKENFFDSDEIIVLESMPDGHMYSNILLKLYLRSLKHEGKLMFNERIPFNATMLANVTRHQVGTIEKAIDIFQSLGLIEVLDNGAIYMLDIQNFIGETSTEADRIRAYRKRIDDEKRGVPIDDNSLMYKCNDKSTPEIDIELEKDTKIKQKQSKRKKQSKEQSKEKEEQKKRERDISTTNAVGGARAKAKNARARENCTTSNEPTFDVCCDLYCEKHLLGNIDRSTLVRLYDEHGGTKLHEAIFKTISNDEVQSPLAYITGILNDWKAKGLETLEDVRNEEEERQEEMSDWEFRDDMPF